MSTHKICYFYARLMLRVFCEMSTHNVCVYFHGETRNKTLIWAETRKTQTPNGIMDGFFKKLTKW